MQFGPKRGSMLYIFDNFIKDFGLLIIALIIGVLQGDAVGTLTDNIVVLVCVLLLPFQRLLNYLFTIYEVDDTKLIIRKGFLNKKVTEVPLSTITTIDMSQNLLCQLLGRYKLKVDNVSNMTNSGDESKVNMIFAKKDAFLLREILEKQKEAAIGDNLALQTGISSEEEEEVESHFYIGTGKIILMGLVETKAILLLEGFGVLMMSIGFLQEKEIYSALEKLYVLSTAIVICLIFAFILIMMTIGAIMSVIRFKGFTVENRSTAIGIKYGLFTKKSFTLQKDRISGFVYKQSWLMRKLKIGTVEVFAIGFGQDSNDAKERAVIHPLLPETELKNFVSGFIGEFDTTCTLEKPDKGAFRYFFYRVTFVLSIITLAGSMVGSVFWVSWLWSIGLLIFLYCLASRIMEYNNTRIGGNSKNIQLITGGINSQRTFIKTDNVESITDKGSRWKRKNGYITVHINFLGPVISTAVNVYNVRVECAEALRKLLIY